MQNGKVSDSFRILVVCTGNICRSPAGQLMIDRLLEPAAVRVESAGTRAMAGRGVPAPMLELLAERGIDGSHHVARQLTRQLLESADLVLTATREHRSHVATMSPPLVQRIFTLTDFGALLRSLQRLDDLDPVDALRMAMRPGIQRPAHSARARRDIVDPYGRSMRVYRESLRQLDEAIEPFAALQRSAHRIE